MIRDIFVKNFLIYIYFKCILSRNLAYIQYKKIKSHFYINFFLYYIKIKFEKSILVVIAIALKYKKAYIK